MKRLSIVLTLILALAIGIAGCQGLPNATATAPAAAANTTPAQAGDATAAAPADQLAETDSAASAATDATATTATSSATGRVVADAKVVPIQSANLSISASGIVKQLTVQEGDTVVADQLLLKLDDAQRQVAVAQAQANLRRAQASLAQLQAGAREQEIAQAEAGLAAAQASYTRLANAAAPGNIAAAQAGVAQAQANLQKVLEGASEDVLIAAKAEMMNAEARLRNATSAYNKVKDESDIGMRQESLALEQATIAFEAARARMQDLENGATPATVAGAQAGVNQAAAQLDTLKKSMPSDLAAAQAAVDQAQAQLDLLNAGARPEAIAIAEADVAAAVAALQQSLVSLSDTELRAPFGGIVATVNAAVGEQVSPGVALIQLADTASWEIETSDLTEFDVVGIKPGDAVNLTFDAIPDLLLTGTVSRVRPIGEDNRGDTVYKVVVKPSQSDPRLLWNMTAVAEFGAN